MANKSFCLICQISKCMHHHIFAHYHNFSKHPIWLAYSCIIAGLFISNVIMQRIFRVTSPKYSRPFDMVASFDLFGDIFRCFQNLCMYIIANFAQLTWCWPILYHALSPCIVSIVFSSPFVTMHIILKDTPKHSKYIVHHCTSTRAMYLSLFEASSPSMHYRSTLLVLLNSSAFYHLILPLTNTTA